MTKLDHQRRRDDQAWIYDWVVQQTGSTANFEYGSRALPRSVRSYAMISKHVGRQADHRMRIADAAAAAGHGLTARDLYQQALICYHTAQHSVLADDDPMRAALYGRLATCWERIVALSDRAIEPREIPCDTWSIAAAYSPVTGGSTAPIVIWVPGMDDIKERATLMFAGMCRQRGLHFLSFDGPGQGASAHRGVRLTGDNFVGAIGAVADYVAGLDEVDSERILLYGMGTSSTWVIRAAAALDRFAAVAVGPSTSFGDLVAGFEQASPRYKRIAMHSAGITDEDAFDQQIASQMSTRGIGRHITCPTLLVQGEYDPMSPLEDGTELFDELAGPKEHWILEDDFHGGLTQHDGLGNLLAGPFIVDWLADAALRNTMEPGHSRVKWIHPSSGAGPFGDD